MILAKFSRYLIAISLIIILVLIPVVEMGCAGPKGSGTLANELATTLVPDVNLDIYLYIHQGSPTLVPKNLIGASNDISVDSLAIWGILQSNNYSVGGALAFTNATDASYIYSQLPQLKDLWTKLSSNTIYLVQGSGGPAESLISAISNNNFKQYDDNQALAEVSLMPDGSTTKPTAIAIIKPTQAAVNLLKQYLDANTMSTIDSIYTWAKPQVIVIGLYSSQPIDVADMGQRMSNNTIWDTDLGVVASGISSFPGFVVSPIAGKYLDNTGYPKATVGNLTVYKASLYGDNGKIIPILINVDGNHVFATASGKESYADTLMTSITR